jgi:hypothetical protein
VDKCFHDSKDQYYAKLEREYWTFKLQANLEPRTLSELLRGERHISYQLSIGGPRPLIGQSGTIVSTARGLQSPQVTTAMARSFAM